MAQEKPEHKTVKTKKKRGDKITPKQLKFAKVFVETSNATEAYRQAYNTKANPVSISPAASRLINHNCKVAAKVEELQNKLLITTETQVMKLERIHDLAIADKQYPSAINAINSQSKHVGLINDKPTVNVNINKAESQLEDVTPETLNNMLAVLNGDITIE